MVAEQERAAKPLRAYKDATESEHGLNSRPTGHTTTTCFHTRRSKICYSQIDAKPPPIKCRRYYQGLIEELEAGLRTSLLTDVQFRNAITVKAAR